MIFSIGEDIFGSVEHRRKYTEVTESDNVHIDMYLFKSIVLLLQHVTELLESVCVETRKESIQVLNFNVLFAGLKMHIRSM